MMYKKLHQDFAAVPFRDDEENRNSTMEIGYIVRKNAILSKMGEQYVRALGSYLESGDSKDEGGMKHE